MARVRSCVIGSKWGLALVFALAWWASAAQAAETSPLTTIAAVRALSHEDAARHLPVDIQATVTFFRGFEWTLFVQEGETGIYVNASPDLRLQPGDVIRVRGTTADSFNPIVVSSDITLLGHGRLPEPVAATWQSLVSADNDCRWVKVQGTVALAEMGSSSARAVTHLVLGMNGGRTEILIDGGDPAQLKGLLEAKVEISAVAGELFDGKMQQTGVALHVPSFAYVRILKQSPVDPWSIPLTPMDKVLRGYNVIDNTPRVRVEGTLTYYRQTESAMLQDGNKSIRVLTSQVAPLHLGDKAEAIGVPVVEDGLLTIKMGQIRSEGPGVPVTPRLVNWDELTSGKNAFDLVTIEGVVVTEVQEHGVDVYVISTGKHVFSASLRQRYTTVWPLPEKLDPMREIPVGTKVRVTGVAALENGNPYNGPIAFVILLRSADDIATVASPPWLTVRHLSELVGFLLLVILAVSVRAWLVERGTRRKITGMAYLEQRRAKVLELINTSHPLTETLEQITEMASASLSGAPCWCQVSDGARIGNRPPRLEDGSLRVIEREIPSRVGGSLGTVYAAFHARTKPQPSETTVVGLAAGLATLAIDTSRLYSDLVRRSEFDLLTDVQNRFSLEKFIDDQIEGSCQSARIFGLLYVDLDQFKIVNDLCGHHVGDMYLQEAARRMKQQLRPGDMLARLGGDEFVAVAPHVRNRGDAEEIARRLERCFAEPFYLQGQILRGSVSVGVAMYPEDGSAREALLTTADVAMYKAKNARRKLSMDEQSSVDTNVRRMTA